MSQLLDSVVAQSHHPTEVILVDAGSTDRTVEIAEGYATRLPLKVVRGGRLNPGDARNAGAAEASGDWIAFTDCGIELDERWLEKLSEEMATTSDVVFGSYEPLCPNLLLRAAAVAYVPLRAKTGVRGPAAVSMAIRRGLWGEMPGFPPHRAAEDLLFFDTLRASSARLRYAPAAVVHWQLASSLAATFRRFALYSEENLRADYGRHWHRGLLLQYVVVGLGFAVVSLLAGAWLAAVLLPTWFLARALRAAWRKRHDLPFPTLSPGVVGGAALVLLVLDSATWTGALRYWFRRR